MAESQNYKNHARIVPMFHYGVLSILLLNLMASAWELIQLPSLVTVARAALAVGLILLAFSLRVQILTVQDRVIRLEMQLRLQAVLPKDVAVVAGQLPAKRLVALRFASDAELPTLVNDVLSGQLTSNKSIKERIKDWQADHLRA